MLETNEALTHSDLIRPLSLEALEYFASGDIPVAKSYQSALRCKFIRFGDAIMIGAAIDFGKEDYRGRKNSIYHVGLFNMLEADEDLHKAAESEPVTTGGRYPGVFNDGGYATIEADGVIPVGLVLDRDSFDYGRADEAGRQRSVEIAQKLVGDTVEVIARA